MKAPRFSAFEYGVSIIPYTFRIYSYDGNGAFLALHTPLSCLQNWGRRVLSLVRLFATTCTVARQASLSVCGIFHTRVLE